MSICPSWFAKQFSTQVSVLDGNEQNVKNEDLWVKDDLDSRLMALHYFDIQAKPEANSARLLF